MLCADAAVVGSGIRAMDGHGPAAKAHFQAVASARHVVQGRRGTGRVRCSWLRVGPKLKAHNCRSFASRGWSSGQVILPGHFSRNSTGPVIWAKWPVTGTLHRLSVDLGSKDELALVEVVTAARSMFERIVEQVRDGHPIEPAVVRALSPSVKLTRL